MHTYPTPPPVYRYRVERPQGDTWEAIDTERFARAQPLTEQEAAAHLTDAAARWGPRLKLVEEVVQTAVRAVLTPEDLDPVPMPSNPPAPGPHESVPARATRLNE